MFDISFSELLIIGIVALLVIGPEKLPKVARTVGAFTGRLQRYVGQVKEEVNREMRFEELQKLQQEIKAQASQLQNVAQTQFDALKTDVEASLPETQSEQEAAEDFQLTPPTPPARKLSQFSQRPARPVDTPLNIDTLESEPVSKAATVKTRASKRLTKKSAKQSTLKKTVSKKTSTQA